jgi:radical SAM superfamily enzyme YgiQ (UPF0313 family)
MTVHLVNPSHLSFGVGVITPRWLFVLAAATPAAYGRPRITDETLESLDAGDVQAGDIVGIGIHTGNALRGYEIGTNARARGATVVFGGIHATLYPDEAQDLGGAHAVVRGDGDLIWPCVLDHAVNGTLQPIYEGGRVDADRFVPARWELLPEGRYMWGSVQTVRGCPKHCSFCSVWRTDGQKPRQRAVDSVVAEIIELRRRGFRFVALADDNFYPVTLADLAMAERQRNPTRLEQLRALRSERFELMARLAELPSDMVFFTQITMEAAEDEAFLDAMRRANIKGALVGVEAVTPEGLKDVSKSFNDVGEALVERLRKFRDHGVHVLGSFIFGLPSDQPSTFEATADVAERAGITFAQFVMLTPFPGTVDFAAWEKSLGSDAVRVAGIPITRHWLIPQAQRPKVYAPHPVMTPDEIRARTQAVWDRFYSLRKIWARSRCTQTLRSRLAFVLISKLYRQMYANTGIATDSARVNRANRWARLIARPCRRLFVARP